jgi:predicted TIM-barrel fold metal-dependent hydrolase
MVMSVSPVFSCLVLFGGFVGRYACGLHEQVPSTASRPAFDVAVGSISAPGVHLGDDTEALDLARRCNDCLAEMVRDRPDRFCGFAILPLPDVDAALGELTRALDVLRLDGVVLMTNALGHYLGDPLYRPLFDELQRRGAVVFLHPAMSPDPSAHRLGLNDSLLDFPVNTARTVAQMH